MKRMAAALLMVLGMLLDTTGLALTQPKATVQPQMGLPLATPLTGSRTWAARDGAASVCLRYTYPQFEA